MDYRTHADSIRALEEQIREHEMAIIRLKRSRNSLLGISKLPPEVLDKVFHWNVTLKGDFDGFDKRSHNFLLVCHHWFEVASQTPEIWSFWGNTPKDWAGWYRRSGTTPLDLILGDDGYGKAKYFDTNLRNALQDRAARDTIRRVHLTADDPRLLNSIIASLTSTSEVLQPNSMESFILRNGSDMSMDLSDFFAHYRFPKLRRLDLTDCAISSWGCLTSRTSTLTTLRLDLTHPSLAPTTSQLFSIFASNPALQKVTLRKRGIPDDGGSGESSRVQLRHLKGLKLMGGLRHIVRLLHQLDLPRNMEKLTFYLHDCDATEISQVIGPYLRGLLQHRDRPQNGLKVSASSRHYTSRTCHITLLVSDAEGIGFSVPAQARIDRFVAITVAPNEILDGNALERATLDLITHIPREEVVHFQTYNNSIATGDACTQFPNLRALSFDSVPLPAAFTGPLVEDGKILPSLEYVLLEEASVNDGDWSPLVEFLTCRVSSGNRLDTLVIANSPAMCPEAMEDIMGMVRMLRIV